METTSEIVEFYKGRSIFITGGSGFMGKVLVEKLLRSCSGLKKVYLLTRVKKEKSIEERLDDMLKSKVFDRVKEEQPNIRDKLAVINGDLTSEKLGISESDISLMASEVSVVFHAAATIKFDEELKVAIETNVLGTLRVIEVCRELPHLAALVHLSTAYCNCDKGEAEEIIYPTVVEPEQLIDAMKWMDKDMVEKIMPKLLGNYPNTYTFTKNLAEKLLLKEGRNLPIAIFRPTTVSSSWKEPFPGWMDSLTGPTGITIGAMKGIVRSMVVYTEKVTDLIPVDICINMIVAIAWYTAKYKPSDVKIYHCGSSTLNPVTWKNMFDGLNKPTYMYPSSEVFRYPGGSLKTSKLLHDITVIYDHYIPAALADALLYVSGKKPRMVSLYQKVDKAMVIFNHFATNEWFFHCKNQFLIWNVMSEEDKQLFNFDVKSMNWNLYWEDFVLGARKYLLKEDPSTIPSARKKLRNLYLRNLAAKVALTAGVAHYVASTAFNASLYDYLVSFVA